MTTRYITSLDEERWNDDTSFDTREQAVAYGHELAADEGKADGAPFWTGVMVPITADELVSAIDSDDIREDMERRLYELVGEVAEDGIESDDDQNESLADELRQATKAWLVRNDLVPKVWQIEHVERCCFEQCNIFDDSPESRRCVRHDQHDGEHDFT